MFNYHDSDAGGLGDLQAEFCATSDAATQEVTDSQGGKDQNPADRMRQRKAVKALAAPWGIRHYALEACKNPIQPSLGLCQRPTFAG